MFHVYGVSLNSIHITVFDRLGEKVFESYAQNNTPGAYRIFWHYGPKKNQITVVAIVSHP